MMVDTDYIAQISALQSENEILRKRLSLYRDIQNDTERASLADRFGLTLYESSLLCALLHGDILRRRVLIDILYGPRGLSRPHESIIGVFMCKLRKKLRSSGVEIESIFGLGYRLDAHNKEKLCNVLNREKTNGHDTIVGRNPSGCGGLALGT